jgi:hypothetical protein
VLLRRRDHLTANIETVRGTEERSERILTNFGKELLIDWIAGKGQG